MSQTSHLKSTSVTNLDSLPVVVNTSGQGGFGLMREATAYSAPLLNDTTASTYLLVRIPTNAVVKTVKFESAAQGAGHLDVGVYYSDSTRDGTAAANQGLAVDADFFASEIDCASAVGITDVTNESGTYTIDKRNQPLWQAVGLTADPGGFFDIAATCTGTAITTGTGKFGVSVRYVV